MSNDVTTTAPINGFAMAAAPANPQEAFALCERFAKSELVPKGFQGKPNDIFIAGMMGARLGLDLFSSLAGIAVVNGRATLWGDSMLAVCQARSDWGGMTASFTNEDTNPTCVVTVTRKGLPPYSASFSMDDAKRAGLAGKSGPWTQYPRRMLELRARAFALRGAYADALSGFHSREEMEDADPIDVTASATVRPATPEPARTAPDMVPATVVNTADNATAPTVAATDAAPVAKAAPHQAIIAARTLYRNLGSAGKSIVNRIAALHGAPSPGEVAADRLDAFGKDVAEISACKADMAAIEDTLGGWEQIAKEGKQ